MAVHSLPLSTHAGLAGVYQKTAPATGVLEQRAPDGSLLYTTHYSEAELLEDSSGLEGAVYRVALATAQLDARRAAIAATLFTWRQQQDTVHFINPYYGSMLARNTDEFDAADAGNQQYNFLPYAIVRCHVASLLVPRDVRVTCSGRSCGSQLCPDGSISSVTIANTHLCITLQNQEFRSCVFPYCSQHRPRDWRTV